MRHIVLLLIVVIAIGMSLTSYAADKTAPVATKPAAPKTEVLPSVTNGGSAVVGSHEDWKGPVPTYDHNAGAMVGAGIYDDSVGFAILGSYAYNIVPDGLIDDVADQMFLETTVGPVLVKSSTAWFYSFHARWNFHQTRSTALYAIGGLGGSITGAALGSSWRLYPRFGAGAIWNFTDYAGIRGELSHEVIAVGMSLAF